MHALAANRVAGTNGDDDLTQISRQSYGKAVQSLNELLSTPEPAFDDEALAAVRCLMIYELFEPSTTSVHAWDSHQNGLVRLVQQRGADGFTTPFGKKLLLDTRGVSMIASIQHSLRSPLGNNEWCLKTDVVNMFAAKSMLYDLAFHLAGIYELDDDARASKKHNALHNFRTAQQLDAIVSHLNDLIGQVRKLQPAELMGNQDDFLDIESALIVANTLALT